jgi:hypothetical protein
MKTLTELMELADKLAKRYHDMEKRHNEETVHDYMVFRSGLEVVLAKVFAENERLKTENLQIHTLMNLYNLGGWTDSLELMKERDSEKQVREQHAETILWQSEEIAKLIAERDAFKVDAESWRKYKQRKDAVIAAGMGRNPLRQEVTPDTYGVINKDGEVEYSAPWREACHDHIKEMQGVVPVENWKVRGIKILSE